jgi:hypothetical protein
MADIGLEPQRVFLRIHIPEQNINLEVTKEIWDLAVFFGTTFAEELADAREDPNEYFDPLLSDLALKRILWLEVLNK